MDTDLILKIYDAALDQDLWPEVLAEVSHSVGASGAIVFECDQVQRQIQLTIQSSNYDPGLIEGYLENYHEYEFADQLALARHSKRDDEIVLISDNILANSREELLQYPHVQSMMTAGIAYRYGTLLNKDDLNYGRFSFQLGKKKKPLTDEQLRQAHVLLPHIAKSLSICRPISSHQKEMQVLEATLQDMPIGVAIINDRGILTYRNSEFLRQLEQCNVYELNPVKKLKIKDERSQSQLNKYMQGVEMHGKFGARPRKEAIITSLDSSELAFCIEICPLSKILPFGEKFFSGHLIYSLDTKSIQVRNFEKISQLYNFTAAETKILKLLSKGMTNRQIAERVSRSVETINTQVSSLYSKTHCQNRTQLVRMTSGFGFELTPR